MKELFLLRGLPGAGKSTLAKSLGGKHIEADMYFEYEGKYKFDASRLKEAHDWCQNTVKVWGAIIGSSGALYNSFGISSSSRISTGVYSISFTRTLGSSRFGSAGSQYGSGFTFLNTESTTSVRVNTQNSSGTNIDSDCQFLIAGGSS